MKIMMVKYVLSWSVFIVIVNTSLNRGICYTSWLPFVRIWFLFFTYSSRICLVFMYIKTVIFYAFVILSCEERSRVLYYLYFKYMPTVPTWRNWCYVTWRGKLLKIASVDSRKLFILKYLFLIWTNNKIWYVVSRY